jgi:3-methyladenine DNA glycosylase AlkD
MTMVTALDVHAEASAITATLIERRDAGYEAGMRRTVPSRLPAHAVRVPEMRRITRAWLRQHKEATPEEVVALAEALWSTGWREELCVAIGLLAESPRLLAGLPWEVIERWSSQIENWEHVDHLMGVTGAMLLVRPSLLADVERLAESDHSWQRRLAIVTLIQATRREHAWLPQLVSMSERLKGDKGPTMRKALAWARKTIQETETKVAR